MDVRETPRAVARTVQWEFAQSTHACVLADVPAALFPWWAQSAHREFPGIPRDAAFYAQAAEGLVMFFDYAAAAASSCALPSRAADSVWHAWTRMDPAGLDAFCIRHVGRAVPHVERARMTDREMGRALAVCLVQARRRASQPAAGSHLPRLFSLDLQLGMPGGFGYRRIGGLVACSVLDEFGNPEGKTTFPGALTPYALYLAGLVSKAEYEQALMENTCARADGAGGTIGFMGVLQGDSGREEGDSVCGDGDSDGSSCGSGCGGGGCGS